MPNVDGAVVLVAQRARRGRLLPVLLGFAAGAVLSAIFLRRQIAALAVRAKPYIRRGSAVSNPALIVNRWSGDGKAEHYGLADAARIAGIRVIMLERGDDITQLARDAIEAGADAIGAAGGDGSLGLVAGVAIEHDVPFFCIPVGTRNHFALDLGLDRDNPLTALDAIRDGEEILIDYGLVGGRPFLNNVSFGIYAEAVHRDEYRENKEKTITEVISEMRAGEDSGSAISFTTPDGAQAERTAMTMVSNNPYVFSGPPDYGRRLRLDTGMLGISAAAHGTAMDGRTGSRVRHWEADRLLLESDAPILAGLDGEAMTFNSTLEVVMRPRGLRVLVPAGTKPGYVPTREALAAGLIGLARLAGVPGADDPDADGSDTETIVTDG
jgi:diacylglycerol kinase family enzyme